MFDARDTDLEYNKRVLSQIDQYKSELNIHDLPLISHFWSNHLLMPRIKSIFGTETVVEFYSAYILEASGKTNETSRDVLSIGAGDGSLEIEIVKNLCCRFSNFKFHLLEISPELSRRAETRIAAEGLQGQMIVINADASTWSPDRKFFAVMAHHSLHHIVALEHVFSFINESLLDHGYFLSQDIIGRNGHMRWPETLAVVERIWQALPNFYKYNHQHRRVDQDYINWDCSVEGFEGIRAQDILPLLIKCFSFKKFLTFGGVIDPFIDRAFGPNFDPHNPQDRCFVFQMQALEDWLIEWGYIKPTAMISVMTKKRGSSSTDEPMIYACRTPDFSIRHTGDLTDDLAENIPPFSFPAPLAQWQRPNVIVANLPTSFDLITDATLSNLRATGWSVPEPENGGCWSSVKKPGLFLSFDQGIGSVTLGLEFLPYLPPGSIQKIEIWINSSCRSRMVFRRDELVSEVLRVDVPDLELDIRFVVDRPRIPGADGSTDVRELGLLLKRITVSSDP